MPIDAVQKQSMLYWATHVMWRKYSFSLVPFTETISKQNCDEHYLSLLVTYDTIMMIMMINIY